MLEGTVDICTLQTVCGWCFDPSRPNRPLMIDIAIDGTRVATLTAATFREDLLAAGKGDGRHGFTFDLTPHVSDPNAPHEITVRASGSTTDLAGSPAFFRKGEPIGLMCYYPWTTLFVNHEGIVHTCACPAFLRDMDHDYVGDRRKQTLEQIWNGPKIRRYRKAFLAGSYDSFCRTEICPYLTGARAHRADRQVMRAVVDGTTELDFGIIRLAHDIDRGCNLRCIMCRDEVIPIDHDAVHRAVADIERVARHGNLQFLHVSGAGEPLIFEEFVDLLATDLLAANNTEVSINTNLTCLSRSMWERIKHNNLEFLVSIDGATATTFERMRPGARWSTVLKRMEFLSDRLARGELGRVHLAFVITASNGHEVGEIIELTRLFGFQLVFYSHLGRLPSSTENIFETCDLEALDMVHDLVLEAGGFKAPHVSLGSCGILEHRRYRELPYRLEMASYQLTKYEDLEQSRRIVARCIDDLEQGLVESDPSVIKCHEAMIADLGFTTRSGADE